MREISMTLHELTDKVYGMRLADINRAYREQYTLEYGADPRDDEFAKQEEAGGTDFTEFWLAVLSIENGNRHLRLVSP